MTKVATLSIPRIAVRSNQFDMRSDYPTSNVMRITPELATKFLATSPGNRALRSSHVSTLAGAMTRGEWRITNQGIGFDVMGRLRDGHHRLNAVILSGVTIETMVTQGLPLNAYEVTDVGAKRTDADILNTPRNLTEIWRLAASIAWGTMAPTIDQIRPFMEGDLGAISYRLIKHEGCNRRYFSTAPMKLAACLSIMTGENEQFVLDQYKALVSLDYDAMTDTSKAFTRSFQSGKIADAATSKLAVLARGLKIFDQSKANQTRPRFTPNDAIEAKEIARSILLSSIGAV